MSVEGKSNQNTGGILVTGGGSGVIPGGSGRESLKAGKNLILTTPYVNSLKDKSLLKM